MITERNRRTWLQVMSTLLVLMHTSSNHVIAKDAFLVLEDGTKRSHGSNQLDFGGRLGGQMCLGTIWIVLK